MITVRLGSEGPQIILNRWGGNISGDEHDKADARRLLMAARPTISAEMIERILEMSEIVDHFTSLDQMCFEAGLKVDFVRGDGTERSEVWLSFEHRDRN